MRAHTWIILSHAKLDVCLQSKLSRLEVEKFELFRARSPLPFCGLAFCLSAAVHRNFARLFFASETALARCSLQGVREVRGAACLSLQVERMHAIEEELFECGRILRVGWQQHGEKVP